MFSFHDINLEFQDVILLFQSVNIYYFKLWICVFNTWICFFQYMNLKFQDVCLSFQVVNLCLLRNKFDIWNVHGIINSSGLLQNKWRPKGLTLTLQETWSIHDSMNILKLNVFLIFIFYYKYIIYRNYL